MWTKIRTEQRRRDALGDWRAALTMTDVPKAARGGPIGPTNEPAATQNDCATELLDAINAYMTPLARGLGHDPVAFDAVVARFERCADLWAREPLVPRNLAHLCASLPAILSNVAAGYNRPDLSQPIYEALVKLDNLVINKVLPWDDPSG